jgi:ribonuclease HI
LGKTQRQTRSAVAFAATGLHSCSGSMTRGAPLTLLARKPNVTIFADASHHERSRVAGWGAWIKADGRDSITCGAAMKVAIASTNEAELCALANALAMARLRGALAQRDVVMLQSDSIAALTIIHTRINGTADRPAPGGVAVVPFKKMKLSKVQVSAIAAIDKIVAALDLSLVTRHVRGHRPGGGRQWVNAEVDRIARKAMRERREAAPRKQSRDAPQARP